jgi:preprotein translocase subunit YajC
MAGFLIFLALALGLMWLLVVLPQRRRQAAHNTLIAKLQPGDEVLTAGGLYGDVTEIGEDEVAIEIAPGVEVRVASRAIAAVIPPDTYAVDEVEAEAEEEESEPTALEANASTQPERR